MNSQNFIDKINSPEYGVWFSMIKRCHDPKNKAYKDYGGRGIFVCDKWLGFNGFDNFILDMGHRPSNDLSLDRIDNDGPYSPENCRWATRKQQARNRRGNRLISINNESKPVAEWAEIAGINQRTVRDRLDAGWQPEDAVFFDVRKECAISIGEIFNSWTVIDINCKRKKNGAMCCKCKCICGTESIITVNDLKVGKSTKCKSCSTKKIIRDRQHSFMTITYNGKTQSLMDWSRELNISQGSIRSRLGAGWSVEKALFGKKHSKNKGK